MSSGRGVEVEVMDSLSMPLNLSTALQICKIYPAPHDRSTLRLKKLSVQQQAGTMDCGLFALAYAAEICYGYSPSKASFEQKKMRTHLHRCLSDGIIVPFPKIPGDQETIPRPTEGICNVKVYCLCRLPEDYDTLMICCDLCQQWYHCVCVGIAKVPRYWICSTCIG